MSNPGRILYPATGNDRFAARPVSGAVLSSPIDRLADRLVIEQEFMQWRNSFTPLALDTEYTDEDNFSGASAWTDYAGFYLVKESPSQDVGGGFCRWTRTFAKVPPQHTLGTMVQYTFMPFYPGQTVITNGVSNNGRGPKQETVPGLAVYDYALVSDPNDLDTFLPPVLAQQYQFQKKQPTLFVYPFSEATQIWPETIPDDDPGAELTTFVTTYPTLEQYMGWVTGLANGVGPRPATVNPATGNYKIVALDAERDVWMGNIWYRKIIYIDPQ